MDEKYYEVDFKTYCALCEHKNLEEFKDPCNECLDYGMNIGTRKPVCFKEKNEK